jgi:hypothetical protein
LVPEEMSSAGSPSEETEYVKKRLERLEHEILRENRWWRGGLIAALVLVALSIFAAGRHRHRYGPGPGMGPVASAPMGMPGWGGAPNMPYWQYGPYPPPPPWAHAWGGPCGCGEYHGHGERGYRRHGDAWGPGPWGRPGSEEPPPPPKG